MEIATIMIAAGYLSKLLKVGLTFYEAWQNEGFDTKELSALSEVLEFAGELGGKQREQELAALHLAIITRCFGQAVGRYWENNRKLAPTQPGQKTWRLHLFMSKEERQRTKELEARMESATKTLLVPGALPAGHKEWSLVESLVGSPLATPYYQTLWKVFSEPQPDTPEADEPLLLELGKNGRMEFERHFLLAYYEALASDTGRKLKDYLQDLRQEYLPRLLRELLLKDMAGWGSRSTFGNIERCEWRDDHPLLFMPLEEMYVEPNARNAGTHDEAPVLEHIQTLLEASKAHILIVRADFGMGKSLTARILAKELANRFLSDRTPSPELELPVFVRCTDDLNGNNFEFESTVRRAWKRQLGMLGLELKPGDKALIAPDAQQRTLFLMDGLDEVSFGETGLKDFFRVLRDEATDRHRFIIFSRPGALPPERDLKEIPVLDILPWHAGQVGEWLNRWYQVRKGMGPTIEDLNERGLGELASTPILLLMIAQTWAPEPSGKSVSLARLYEDFFRSIAQGKHEADFDVHRPVYDASECLREVLVEHELIDSRAEVPDAMLWLMSRVAWESVKLDNQKMLSPRAEGELLTRRHIENLLHDELSVRSHTLEEVADSIEVGLLLTLQTHLRAGSASQILFGHKSFREFLVARFWADRLRALARAEYREWEDIERPLLGGRLLGTEDRAFDFLMDMLNSDPLQHRPIAPFGLTEDGRAALLRWAQQRFESEEEMPHAPAKPRLRDDQKPWLREAALAIGSALHGTLGLRQRDVLTLRTLLGWFWSMRINPIVRAPGALLERAVLDYTLLLGADFTGANLRGADLSEANLSGATLSEATLSEATLSEATLSEATLSGADLRRADLSGATLSGADLSGANLGGANLREATLSGATLSGATLSGANLSGATLSEATLSGANLREATLSGADLVRATLRGATLRGATLRGANLSGANLSGANLGGANLSGANLGGANLGGANLGGASLSSADLREADLREADLSGADLNRADLRFVRVEKAIFSNTKLYGADLFAVSDIKEAELHNAKYDSQTIWPYGFDEKAGAILDEGVSSSQTSLMQ